MEQETLNWLRSVIEGNKVVLFMRGERRFPVCGHSNAAVGLLRTYGKPFEAVNVLADPRIQRALPRYSGWPTFPQIFIDGKFVGDYEIAVQMHEDGRLEALLEAAFDEG